MSDLVANKLILTNSGSIQGIGICKIFGKDDTVDKKSGTKFFTLGPKLAFAKGRQSFSTALSLYHFDTKCHIQIEINGSSYAICGIVS